MFANNYKTTGVALSPHLSLLPAVAPVYLPTPLITASFDVHFNLWFHNLGVTDVLEADNSVGGVSCAL